MLEKVLCFKDALQLHSFLMRDVFSYFKFFDANSPLDEADNYYMEREWRILGNVDFNISEVCRIHMPNEFASQFRQDFPAFAGEVKYPQD